MSIYEVLTSLLTFPGVVSHEFAHKFFCDLFEIKVRKVCYFRFGGEKFSDSLENIHKEDFSKIFQINTVAPLMMAVRFLPMLKKAGNPLIINISSVSGSIARKRRKDSGYSYSSSKAALNMITKALSVELVDSGVIVVSLHPGWVKTSMEYTEKAPLMPNESISGMIKVIDTLKTEDTGKFYDWQGNEVPW